MFIGHYGPAFIAATHRKAPSLGTLFVGCQLLDYGFFGLMLADVEHMRFVPGITAMNAMDLYDMPWTHSLAGALGWSLGFALLIRLFAKSWTAAAIGGAVVFSHWLIDLFVHRPDLTLAGSPPAWGFGGWNHPAIEIPVELAFAVGGLFWFVRATRAKGPMGRIAPFVLLAAMLALQYVNWFGGHPPTVDASFPIFGLVAYTLLALIAWWTGVVREGKGRA